MGGNPCVLPSTPGDANPSDITAPAVAFSAVCNESQYNKGVTSLQWSLACPIASLCLWKWGMYNNPSHSVWECAQTPAFIWPLLPSHCCPLSFLFMHCCILLPLLLILCHMHHAISVYQALYYQNCERPVSAVSLIWDLRFGAPIPSQHRITIIMIILTSFSSEQLPDYYGG